MSEQLLTIKQAAEVLNMPWLTLRDRVTKHRVPHRRLHGVRGVRFAPEDIEAIKAACFAPAITATPSRARSRTRVPRQRSAPTAA